MDSGTFPIVLHCNSIQCRTCKLLLSNTDNVWGRKLTNSCRLYADVSVEWLRSIAVDEEADIAIVCGVLKGGVFDKEVMFVSETTCEIGMGDIVGTNGE